MLARESEKKLIEMSCSLLLSASICQRKEEDEEPFEVPSKQIILHGSFWAPRGARRRREAFVHNLRSRLACLPREFWQAFLET